MGSLTGCAVDEQDLERWETTLTGPDRLTAVVLHEKYDHALRVQSAMSLIRMKPRKGQHIGVTRLVERTLAELQPDARAKILADMVPLVIAELEKPAPVATQGGQASPDPSFKYKDAAYLMLTYDKTQIISDPALKKNLHTALTAWAMSDFDRRLNEHSQAYGMEQLLGHIGSSSIRELPKLMTTDGKNLAKMCDLVEKIGDKETKEAASVQLVKILQHVSSEKWRKDRLPELREANSKAGFDPTEAQLEKQMSEFQDESVNRIFGSMKKVGGSAMVDYCLGVAADASQAEKRRQAALAALEGHIDRKNAAQVEKLLAIAKAEKAPPLVLDQLFRRMRELPRAQVAPEVYKLFESSSWEVRRLAGATLLQMSTVKHVDEFMENLGQKATKNFNLPEAITYGAYLAGLEGGDTRAALEPHMRAGFATARLAAISYWYEKGTKKDTAAIEPLETDGQAAPKCEEDGNCDWTCLVEVDKKKEPKEIRTVGDFVRYCIRPKMEETEPEPPTKKDKKEEKK